MGLHRLTRRIGALAVGACAAAALAVGVPTVAQARSFNDVPSTEWYHPYINQASNLGLMNGYDGDRAGDFGPHDTFSRGAVAQTLFNIAGKPYEVDGTPLAYPTLDKIFGDEYADASAPWYENAVSWCYANAILTGVQTEDPSVVNLEANNPVNREQFALFMQRYVEKHLGVSTAMTASQVNRALASVSDGSTVDDYAKTAVAWAVQEGLIGQNGSVNPQDSANRAEAATMLVRLNDYIKGLDKANA